MPQYALLSDLHANLHALEAVLDEVATTDAKAIVFGGDLVGYGAFPKECVDLACALGGHAVMGNHDHYVTNLNKVGNSELPDGWEENPVWAGIEIAVRQLSDDQLEWLGKLPWTHHLEGALLAHASLHDVNDWPYLRNGEEAIPTIDILRERLPHLGFFGHTHRLKIFPDLGSDLTVGHIEEDSFHIPEGLACAVTMGSVGQPREVDDHRATWILWDSDQRLVHFRRTEYDCSAAAKAILKAKLPFHSAMRLVSEEQATRFLVEGVE